MDTLQLFASLYLLPDVITEPGDYLTRAGEKITVTTVSKKQDFGCIGSYPKLQGNADLHDRWHKSGRLYFNILSDSDIVSRAGLPTSDAA